MKPGTRRTSCDPGADLFSTVAADITVAAANDLAPHAQFPLLQDIPDGWRRQLASEIDKPFLYELQVFLAAETARYTVYPRRSDVFNALVLTPFDKMKVLLLGQDPYHGAGQAHGLCFSVRRGVRPPPSLVNMFRELHDDVGCRVPNHGCLEEWARQGILLLNAVLTVRANEPNSHKGHGWEQFTDTVIRVANERHDPMVFVLWGAYAQKKQRLIDTRRHIVLKAAHPSPFSAKKFFGSRPYSSINEALRRLGQTPIDWQLSDHVER